MARRRRYAHPDPYAPRRFEPLEPPTAPAAMERRHQTHRATFTPPIFDQRYDVDFIDMSNPPFPQPRATGLNDTEEVHSSKGQEAAHEAIHRARDAAHEAVEGECGKAMTTLHAAHGYLGAAIAHSGSGGRELMLGPAAETVRRADAHVAKFCKIVRKGRR
jgi:hypothetical protein